MPEIKTDLFLGSDTYPNDREGLAQKLPDIIRTARTLVPLLFRRTLRDPRGDGEITYNVDGTPVTASAFDMNEVAKRLLLRSQGVATAEKTYFMLGEGKAFQTEIWDEGKTTDYAIIIRDLLLPSPATTFEEAQASHQVRSALMMNAEADAEEQFYGLVSTGVVTGDAPPYGSYHLGVSTKHGVWESSGAPIPSDALHARQQAILEKYGPYGLLYDESLLHLQQAADLADTRAIM